MGDRKLGKILRCTGLTLLVLGVLVLLPASAVAATQHGVSIAKSCAQNINRCATNADCTQPTDICAGSSTCSTTAQNQANVVDCLITVTDSDGFLDSIMINQATDTETNGTGVPSSSSDILVSASSGTVTGPGCAVGQNISPANPCTLAAGASLSFQSKFYVVQAGDPSPLLDRADIALADVCDGPGSNCTGGNGCNCGGVTVSFGASTTLQTGCSAPVNLADSTACPDTDGTLCTVSGCESGVCVQTHVIPPCTAQDDCHTAACNPATGVCVQTAKADSTACADTDGNNCTTAGCEGGVCVQTHVTAPCTAINECNTAACDPATGQCVQTPKSDSTACTDTDGDACTTAGCEAGQCVQAHIVCQTNEICRTPGFWGTHACPGGTQSSLGICEKANSQNITQIVLDNYPGLTICGHPVNTTDLTDTSAVEAICVAIKGDSTLQVARQLTAAALNCIVSNSTGCGGAGQNPTDPCTGVSVDAVFAACNDPANPAGACATTAVVGGTTVDCIEAIDCFNNGGDFDIATGTCSASTNSCHDRLLVNGCFNFEPPGPAGSPKECNDARKDAITIFN